LDVAVICFRNTIDTDKSASLNDLRISNDSGPLCLLLKQVCAVKDLTRRNRLRKGIHYSYCYELVPSILMFGFTSFANCRFNGIGPSRNLDGICLRARDGQHESSGISEIALEDDGAGALR